MLRAKLCVAAVCDAAPPPRRDRSASALCKCSVQVALRKLLCASCSEQVLPELWECTSRTICLYLKVVIFQPELRECAPRTTFVLKSCDFPAGAAGMCSAYYVCT